MRRLKIISPLFLLALIFCVFVSLKIHGSSNMLVGLWHEPTFEVNYVFKSLRPIKNYILNLPFDSTRYDRFLFLTPRPFRTEEIEITSPSILSSLNHPTNFSNDLNSFLRGLTNGKIIIPHVRSFGQYFLDKERAWTWSWWFEPFIAFVAYYVFLYLMFNEFKYAIFGSVWLLFSSGAIAFFDQFYLFTSYPLIFISSLCIFIRTTSRYSKIILFLLIIWSGHSSIRFLYPPWQVPYFYLLIILFFVAPNIKSYFEIKKIFLASNRKYTMILLLVLLFLAIYFLISSVPSWINMSVTTYPRRLLGGGLPFEFLFAGMHAMHTLYNPENEIYVLDISRIGYYVFWPTLIFSTIVYPKSFRAFGKFGSFLWLYLFFMISYVTVGFPKWLASISLFQFANPPRMYHIIGVTSIFLTLMWLFNIQKHNEFKLSSKQALFSSVLTLLFYIVTISTNIYFYPSPNTIFKITIFTSVYISILAYFLLRNHINFFFGGLTLIILFTSIFFYPLSSGLSPIFDTDLGKKMYELNNSDYPIKSPPLWLTYSDSRYAPSLIISTGGNAMAGPRSLPKKFYDKVDIHKQYEAIFIKGSTFWSMEYSNNIDEVRIVETADKFAIISINPQNPILKEFNAKYVLAQNSESDLFINDGLIPIYTTKNNFYTIFEIP